MKNISAPILFLLLLGFLATACGEGTSDSECDDADSDGICDTNDVCAAGDDTDDFDGDGAPDGCDACPTDSPDDSDADGVCDSDDLCIGADDTEDSDGDGVADGCDVCPNDALDDSDGDGSCDSGDLCAAGDDTHDFDGDGVADACDPCPADAADDSDSDGSCDSDDICPGFDDTLDTDGDGVPNGCDVCEADNPDDSDSDGVCDSADVCEGFDDATDLDEDNTPDGCDECPDDGSGVVDGDGDGACDVSDPCPIDNPDDSDNDGVCDSVDVCAGADDSVDGDADGVPDDCDLCRGFDDGVDSDGDTIPDDCDCDQAATSCHLNATCSDSNTGDICACTPGYVGDGVASCTFVDCGVLPSPAGGSVNAPITAYDFSASYTCDAGHVLVGPTTRICQEDGFWSDAAPVCQLVDCGPLVDPPNGSVDAPVSTFLAIASFACDVGYTLAGAASLSCQADGAWSGPSPSCAASPCVELLVAPENGSLVGGSTGVTGDIVAYACDPGFSLQGASTTECLATGDWSDFAPTCTANPCPSLAPPPNGLVSATGGVTGDSVAYACDAGFNLVGSSIIECLASGDWSFPPPFCEAFSCPDVSTDPNGSMSSDGANPPTITFACDEGFTLAGASTATCQSDGQWTADPPICEANACSPSLVSPTNGSVDFTTGVTFDVRFFACDDGYTPAGNTSTQCLRSGSWSTAEPTCEAVSCGTPGTLILAVNASTSAPGVPVSFPETITYSCDAGFSVDGDAAGPTSIEVSCGATGSFSNLAPTCVAIP